MRPKENILLKLLDKSGHKLHGMLYRLTLDEDAAEDLMQELFIRLCELKQPQKIKNLEAYACRIAINLAFDRRRKQRSFTSIPEQFTDRRIQSVDFRLLQKEQLTKTLEAVDKLSDLTRECIVLRHIEQMDYDRIAERMNKSQQQIRGICSKGIQRVREILNAHPTISFKESIK